MSEVGRMPDRGPDWCAAVKQQWFQRIESRMKKDIDRRNGNGWEITDEILDTQAALKFIESASERHFYITVHYGGGSMSECAWHQALFGPYNKAELAEVEERLSAGLNEGYDDGYHIVTVDLSRSTNSVDKFIEKNKQEPEDEE